MATTHNGGEVAVPPSSSEIMLPLIIVVVLPRYHQYNFMMIVVMCDWKDASSYFDVSLPPGIDDRFNIVLPSLQGDVTISPYLGSTDRSLCIMHVLMLYLFSYIC